MEKQVHNKLKKDPSRSDDFFKFYMTVQNTV